MSDEKTEKPTAKRRKQNRKEGQVPRTAELGSWSALAVFALAIPLLLRHEASELKELMLTTLAPGNDLTPASAVTLLGDGLWHVLIAVAGLGAGVAVIGVAGSLAQGGFYLATSSVKPKLSKLNPLQGFKRIFGLRMLWDGAKMLLRGGVVALLVWMAIDRLMPLLGGLMPMQVVLDQLGVDALSLLRNVAIVGVVLAAADYIMQRRRVGKQTRMTKHEVKQEYKQTEGDPMVKSAIRSRQLAAARNRMMADVPTADVVLVNPTHVAVALRYDPERGAPRVVAKGAGVIAKAIRDKAGEADVPLVRDVPLARALYTATKVGQEIPAELFTAVAQVLAFIISRRNRGHRGGEFHTPRVEAELPEVIPSNRRRRPTVDASGPAPAGR